MPLIASASRDDSGARLSGLLIALLVVAVLWTDREIPGFDYALLMDDDTNILFNAHLGVLDGARLRWMFTDLTYVARYMPLGWLSFNLVATWSDLSPFACHVAGVGFHTLNAVVVLLCLRILIRRFAPDAPVVEQALGAGMGALLWALNPLRVEPVAWCSGLLYVEGGFFALIAVYARLRELETRSVNSGRPLGWFGIVAVAFALSLLVYPVALFLPGAVMVLDYAWLKKGNRPVATALRRVLGWEWGVLVAMSGLALWATLLARHGNLQNGLPLPAQTEFGLVPRVFQAGYVWASYVWRTLWPVNLTPGVEALFEIRAWDVRIWGAFPTLIGLTALAWRWRRTAPFLGACWLGYLFWMIPVLGLMEHPHVAADRYSYLAGLLFPVVLVLGGLRVRPASMRLGLFVLGAIVAAGYAGLSFKQARLWRDPLTIHQHMLARFKDVDLRNIALVRMAKLRFLSGDVREGRALAQRAYAGAPQIAGVARVWLEMMPEHPLSPEVAARPLQEWPAAPWACLHERIAVAQLGEGRARDALMRLDAALALSPDFAEVRFRRALVLAGLGRPRAALHDWLVLEARDGRAISADGIRFAAKQIAQTLSRAGDDLLANALRRRAAVTELENVAVPFTR